MMMTAFASQNNPNQPSVGFFGKPRSTFPSLQEQPQLQPVVTNETPYTTPEQQAALREVLLIRLWENPSDVKAAQAQALAKASFWGRIRLW